MALDYASENWLAILASDVGWSLEVGLPIDGGPRKRCRWRCSRPAACSFEKEDISLRVWYAYGTWDIIIRRRFGAEKCFQRLGGHETEFNGEDIFSLNRT